MERSRKLMHILGIPHSPYSDPFVEGCSNLEGSGLPGILAMPVTEREWL